MIDFACRQFNLDDIIKCSLGLTKTEFKIMDYFLENKFPKITTLLISKKLDLNLTTVQKAVKKLYEKKIILRHQKNLEGGGYIYTYESNSRQDIRKIIRKIIEEWFNKVNKKINNW
ncbi:MAG: winged helix-turn-helix transcriptional regulator [Nanoarchaeota archaeon]|nr:winged helix-turn-helix transcriptional regulator [Nanoarchaeota archaeon]